MNYASISDWLEILSQCVSEEADIWGSLTPNGCGLTAGETVSMMADNGIEALKRATCASPAEAESLELVWWTSQALKKFEHGCVATKQDAITGFCTRNDLVQSNRLNLRLKSRMRDLLRRALPEVDDEGVDGRFGPGAVAEKMDGLQRWTASGQFSYDIRSMHLFQCDEQLPTLSARLQAVPKSFKAKRLITIEPAENSFGQQWTRFVLMKSIRRGSLAGTVMDQSTRRADTMQRKRCVKCSITGREATLDLSDASDCIGWVDVCDTFPCWVVALLERFRTPMFSCGPKEPERVLRIYAGMGNATTFIVETLYFWALVTAVSEWLGDFTPVTVFGDDIICGTKAATHPLFDLALAEAGLKVNEKKSGRSAGPGFRESCGVVAHSGHVFRELIRISGFASSSWQDLQSLCMLHQRLAAAAYLGEVSACENRSEEDPDWAEQLALTRDIKTLRKDPPEIGTIVPSTALLGIWDKIPLLARAQARLAMRIGTCLADIGVPNLKHALREEGVWFNNWAFPFTPTASSSAEAERLAAAQQGAPQKGPPLTKRQRSELEGSNLLHAPLRFRYNRARARVEYRVGVSRPLTRVYRRNFLTASQAAGVLNRSLGHVDTERRKGKRDKRVNRPTILSVPMRGTEVVSMWVGSM